jgi:hypothetical protein
LTKYKLYDDPKPFLVGIAWVVQCAEKLARVDEEGFRVKTDEVSALDLKRVCLDLFGRWKDSNACILLATQSRVTTPDAVYGSRPKPVGSQIWFNVG